MDDRRALAHAADDTASIDAAQQAVEIRVVSRVVADDGVLDAHRDAVVDQPRDGVEPLLSIGPERVFGLQIQDERQTGDRGDLSQAGLEAARVARVAARQHHGGAEAVSLQQARLVHRAAEGRSDAWNRPPRRREPGQPLEQRRVFIERDVVQERVAAVEVACDAALLDVLRHAFGGIEVERAA